MCSAPAGAITQPAQWAGTPEDTWIAIDGPTTVAAALRGVERWSLDEPARRFDAEDWWFRLRFDAPATTAARTLSFAGLAGLAEVWLNGELLLTSSNMFVSHDCADPPLNTTGNELLIRFASLDAWLAQRRPRPRWRAPMVEHQQLRWVRTSLLGHVPGWAPPAAPVGPWRGVELIEHGPVTVSQLRLRSHVDGRDGVVTLAVALNPADASAQLELERDGVTHRAALAAGTATLRVPDAALWWPHTHGEPALYDARIVLRSRGSDAPVVVDLGRIGFRSLALDTAGGDFALRINDVPVFCRGACWMPLDVVSLRSSRAACRAALEQVRDAGMNMLRVTGTMVYEEDHFHELCDELGILVWQDFMFANMDYPHADDAFAASVRDELTQQLERWQARPSLAVLCGNSEAEQQAAMWGSPRETWAQPAFDRTVGELVQAWCPGVPYWPSSAHGGAFPHQNDVGTTSYYGVGAYLRPLDDARRSGVRFATECLAFSNVPPDSTIQRMPAVGRRPGQPDWRARSPRDLGAGWDFEDVRDHYLQRLYGLDPVALRSTDQARYLTLSRAVGAEVMYATLAEWRSGSSSCRGALVWFLRDLWPGAGWGILDDRGTPKAAFHGLRRAASPIALFISDEGTNGLQLHVVNEPAHDLQAQIEITVYRDDGLVLEQSTQAHTVPGRGALSLPVAEWFDTLLDLSRAYRFGPAEHALVAARLLDAQGDVLARAFHLPEGLPTRRERDIGMVAHARIAERGQFEITLRARGFAQSVHFDAPGFVAEDEFFHLAPGAEQRVRLTPTSPGSPVPSTLGSVLALNTWAVVPIRMAS